MKNNIFKKINTENCTVNVKEDTLKCTNPLFNYYHPAFYTVEVELKDKETGTLIDTFDFDFGAYSMDDENGSQWRYAIGNYIGNEDIIDDPDLWNDDEKEYEASVIYDSWSAKKKAKFDKWYKEDIAEMSEESHDWEYFHQHVKDELIIAYWLDEGIKNNLSNWLYWDLSRAKTTTNVVKFYSIGANGTVILYDVEDADWNDVGDKILVGKNIKRVFNINEEAFLQKQGNTVFSINYSGSIDYYEKEKDVEEPDYLEVGENFGFYANKNNCGFFVEAK